MVVLSFMGMATMPLEMLPTSSDYPEQWEVILQGGYTSSTGSRVASMLGSMSLLVLIHWGMLIFSQVKRAAKQEKQEREEQEKAGVSSARLLPDAMCAIDRGCCAVAAAPGDDDEAKRLRRSARCTFCFSGVSLACLVLVLGVNAWGAGTAIEGAQAEV